MKQLSINSSLSYLIGGGMPNMRLRRLTFKQLKTAEGAKFDGLPVQHQIDEHLSRYSYGNGRTSA